jgi:hypothetical protein
MRHSMIACTLALGALALSGPATANDTFVAPLNGAEQVPPFETQARGNAIVKVRADGMSYQLIVAALQNIVAAHIHCAPVGLNGPIGVTLFAGSPVTVSGILAQGPILAPDAGNACGWMDVADVTAALQSGDTYVNVHTLQSLPGEVRGQLR